MMNDEWKASGSFIHHSSLIIHHFGRWREYGMTVAIKVPSVGESITEGTIARWLKKDGAAVKAQEPLFELETDKATTAVPAPADGTLHITVAEGQAVQVGAVVGHIEPGGAAPAGNDR